MDDKPKITYTDAIVKFIQEHPETTIDAIHAELQGNKPTINTLITKLIEKKRIKRVSQGHYAGVDYISPNENVEEKIKKSSSSKKISTEPIPELSSKNLVKLRKMYGSQKLIQDLKDALELAELFK